MTRPTLVSLQREVDRVDADQSAHERVCAERYTRIDEALGDMKSRNTRIETAVWGIVIAVLGYLAVQVWEGRNLQVPQTPSVAVAK